MRGPAGIIGSGALGEVRRGLYRGVEVALKGLHMLRTDAASVSLSCPAARAAATGTRRSLGERDGSGLNFVMTLSKQSIAQSVDPFPGSHTHNVMATARTAWQGHCVVLPE